MAFIGAKSHAISVVRGPNHSNLEYVLLRLPVTPSFYLGDTGWPSHLLSLRRNTSVLWRLVSIKRFHGKQILSVTSGERPFKYKFEVCTYVGEKAFPRRDKLIDQIFNFKMLDFPEPLADYEYHVAAASYEYFFNITHITSKNAPLSCLYPC